MTATIVCRRRTSVMSRANGRRHPVPQVSPDRTRIDLSPAERSQIESSLIDGALGRASTLSFVYALTFAAYSFTSFGFVHAFDNTITLFQNTWPRLLFNVAPLAALGFYTSRQGRTSFRLVTWCLCLSMLFTAACLVHVWPIMWSVTPDIYLYVHAANVFVIATSLIMVAPPPRYVVLQVFLFLFLVIVPIFVLLLRAEAYQIASMAAGDFAIGLAVSISVARVVHHLRWRLAVLDLQVKRSTTPFLGKRLVDAIYRNELETLRTQHTSAVILTVDIRGYTDFYRSTQAGDAKQFMQAYHAIVSRCVGETGGYWHKSIGDGALASFGAMDAPSDADRAALNGTMGSQAVSRRMHEGFAKAMRAATLIHQQFATLRATNSIDGRLSLGMALAYGEVEVRLQGDDDYKLELDIDGEVVLRCSRLEAHTKILRQELGLSRSIIIISPELIPMDEASIFQRFETKSANTQVRNYPDIVEVGYYIFAEPLESAPSTGRPSHLTGHGA